MKDEMASVYSAEYHEDVVYYISDLDYSDTVLGAGYKSGKPYNLTFDEDGNIEEIELIY